MIFIIYFVVATSTEEFKNNTFKDQRTWQKKKSSVVQEAHLLFYFSH